jgi:hypothetical protein
VTNAGMENAVSVVVTTTGNATPIYPYKNYVVGTLKPDDFSSFELTFDSNLMSIPIEITFKDDDGNQYNRTTDLDLTHATKLDSNNDESLILLVLFILICLGGVGVYVYRKRIFKGASK